MNLRELRKINNISQTELAEKLNMTQQGIARIEKEGTTKFSTAIKISKFFKIPVEQIFLGLNTIDDCKNKKKNN